MSNTYHACKSRVTTRGVPPDSFLDELVVFGRTAPDEIFSINSREDIYSVIRPELGPWTGLLHRRAAMLEALRILAGFESRWRWTEGVDITNQHSLTHIEGQETGAFQVSFNSTVFDASLRDCVRRYCGALKIYTFIDHMKTDHQFAIEYAARLLRFTTHHNGPVLRREINPWLRREAVAEFQWFL